MTKPEPTAPRLAAAADLSRYALLVLSLYFVATFVIAAMVRAAHPFALDWLEGGAVDRVARVVEGLPLYTEPSLAYVATGDGPLFAWLAGALSWLLGVGFLPLRLVSLAASLAALFATFRLVDRETSDRWAALAGAGFFAATYRLSGDALDTGQSDALALALVLLGAERLRAGRGARGEALAAAAFVAAVLTQPITAIPLLALALQRALALRGARRFVFGGVALGASALAWLAGELATDGWLGFFAGERPLARTLALTGHELWQGVANLAWRDLAASIPVPTALALVSLILLLRTRGGGGGDGGERSFYWLLCGGLVATSLVRRVDPAAGASALIPAYAAVALLAGIAVAARPFAATGRARRQARGLGAAGLLGLRLVCAAQLAALYYDPGEVIPGEVDRAEGDRQVALMRAARGEIFSPVHGQLPRLAGHAPSAHGAAIADVVRAGGPVAEALAAELERAFAEHRFAVVFGPPLGFDDLLRTHYTVHSMGSPPAGLAYPRGPSFARSRDVFVPRVP